MYHFIAAMYTMNAKWEETKWGYFENSPKELITMAQEIVPKTSKRNWIVSQSIESAMNAPMKKTYIAGSKWKKPHFTLGSL
jgi:hypothetical protein